MEYTSIEIEGTDSSKENLQRIFNFRGKKFSKFGIRVSRVDRQTVSGELG